jgi:hypothetical protein
MRALREMAADEGHVKPGLLKEIEQLGEVAQKLRRDMVDALVSSPQKYKKLKSKAEEIVS